MLIPGNIRELAYIHSRNYNIADYLDYELHLISLKVLSFCNKDTITEYINSLDNKEQYLNRIKI